jgi:hypothetical protein
MSLTMLAKNTSYESSHCVIFSIPLTLYLPSVDIFSLFSPQTPSMYVRPAIQTKNIRTTSLEHLAPLISLSRRINLLNFWRSEGVCKHPHSITLSPRANYTDRATAACRRSDWQILRDRGCHMVSVTDTYGRILGFLDRSRYFSIK